MQYVYMMISLKATNIIKGIIDLIYLSYCMCIQNYGHLYRDSSQAWLLGPEKRPVVKSTVPPARALAPEAVVMKAASATWASRATSNHSRV